MSTGEWIATVIIGLGTAVINKIWNRSNDKKDQAKVDEAARNTDFMSQCATAISVASSVMTQIVLTAKPDATLEWVIQQCKGAVAIQMAKLRNAVASKPWALLIIDSPAVQLLIDDAIAAAAKRFVEIHPKPHTVELPISKKLIELSIRGAGSFFGPQP
jgi:hypothetical protein